MNQIFENIVFCAVTEMLPYASRLYNQNPLAELVIDYLGKPTLDVRCQECFTLVDCFKLRCLHLTALILPFATSMQLTIQTGLETLRQKERVDPARTPKKSQYRQLILLGPRLAPATIETLKKVKKIICDFLKDTPHITETELGDIALLCKNGETSPLRLSQALIQYLPQLSPHILEAGNPLFWEDLTFLDRFYATQIKAQEPEIAQETVILAAGDQEEEESVTSRISRGSISQRRHSDSELPPSDCCTSM